MTKEKSILEKYSNYEANIGIEIHIQLKTKSKIFCSCSNEISKEPNKNICPICSGYPGVLPVLNKKVVEYAVTLGLATDSKINKKSEFSRKHYFYPDLPKNYQITQGNIPICQDGHINIHLQDNSKKKIDLIRIHMEEDSGKSIHSEKESFIDINRAGTPLLEVVSHPDISNAYEAKEYLKNIRNLVLYLGISTANMEDGAFRADTNISVRKKGMKKLGTRCELKNINSFKFISDAIDYEIERQIKLLEEGENIKQETRLWDSKEKKTYSMRSKEETADYRYFIEPDLPIIFINDEWLKRIEEAIPELPEQKFDRLIKELGISPYEAKIIIEDKYLSEYLEKSYELHPSKQIVNWIIRDVLAYLNEQKISINEFKVTPEKLAYIIKLIDKDSINAKTAKEIFEIIAKTGEEPEKVIQEKSLLQISSTDDLEKIIQDILRSNSDEVKRFLAGENKLIGFFMGEAMKKTNGKGNPKIIQELFKKLLK